MTKKILVTGGAGYVGRHVVDALIDKGYEVYIADPTHESTGAAYHLVKEPIFSGHKDIFKRMGSPDVVIHLAWQDGFKHYEHSHVDNLAKHYHFINDMINGGLTHFIGMGTMHEVGYHEGVINNDTPTNPQSPYGISKNSLRLLTALLAKDKAITYQWLRAFYITGDDERSKSVFSKILEADSQGEKTFPFSSGKNKYDFIDVKELGNQIAAVVSRPDITGLINCCSGAPMTLGERAEQFIRDNSLKIKLEYGAFPDRPYDSPGVWGDDSLIKQILKQSS